MTLRRRGDGEPLLEHLLLVGQVRTNIINLSLDRRLGNRPQKESGKDQRNVPETDAAYHSKIAGQADTAVAHMLRGRYALDCWCNVPTLVLTIQIVPLGSDEPILHRIVERRKCMHIDVVGFLTPRKRRGRPSLMVHIPLSQIAYDNRRAVFDGRAHKSVLVHLRDSRRKLHLHCNRHPIPFITTDWPVDKLRRG
jgi:hypothetical protein